MVKRAGALTLFGLAMAFACGPLAGLPAEATWLHDERAYLSMAKAVSLTQVRQPPFCWRVLLPWLVKVTAADPNRGFYWWMVAALAVLPPLTAIFLRSAGVSERAALVGGALIAVAPPVFGLLPSDYIRTDGLGLVLVLVASIGFIRGWAVVFVASMMALALTRETWLMVSAFTLLWSRTASRRATLVSVMGTAAALAVALFVRWTIPASAPYSWMHNAQGLYSPLSLTVVSRRLMLAVGATWNVLAIVLAMSLARRLHDARAWAIAAATVVATAQIAVAIDTQRLVAAAYPFVLLAIAWEIDALEPRSSRRAAAVLLVAQVPWLLRYTGWLTMSFRWLDIALSVAAVLAGIAAAARYRLRSPAGSSMIET
jgi:hypothetical protein